MARIEDQRILIWCNQEENLQQTIIDAIHFAIKFEKEICFFANYTNEKERNRLTVIVSAYSEVIKKDLPNLFVSTLLLKGELASLVRELGDLYNSIMLCTGGKITNKLLQAFYNSGFPFYFSRDGHTEGHRFRKVIIPVDFRNSTKESALWGSYFGRFNHSEIVLLKANEDDVEQKRQVETIVAFVKKFYGQFFFNFWVEDGKSTSWGIHKEGLSKWGEFDLVIFTGSLNVTIIDWVIGTFEKRLVNRSALPVLLINPQKEMYVLCN